MTLLKEIVLQQGAVFVALVIFSLVCWYYWSHRRIILTAWKLPTVAPTLPFVGHGWYTMLFGTDWVVNFFIERIKQYMIYGSSDKGAVWIGPYPIFWISDPEDIHTVLNNTKSMEGGIEKMFLTYALGDGLLTAPGSVWKMTRRHVNPLFHPRNLNLMYPMLNEFGRDLVGNMTQHVGRGLVDAETVVNPIIFKSSCKVVFGIDSYINMSSEKFKNFHKASHRISKLLGERGVRIYAWPELLFNILYKRDIKQINDSCNTFIAEAFEISKEDYLIKESLRNQAKTLSIDRKDLNSENTSDGRVPIRLEDALKTVKEYIPNFTDQDLINEAKTLIVVGSESIRVTLSSCLLALAAHPHVQEKLYAEIVSVTGTQDGDVTPKHIRAMPYLDQVLKETMRKFLIVPVISRSVKEDLKLKDWTVPQGSIVWTFILGVHFNPRLYPDPERFDPDRFNPENEAARGQYSFIPFSSGPRNCIGKVYANMLLKTLVIHVLKRFKFSTTVNINSRMMVKCGIAFSLQNGYKVEIENRKN